MLSSRYLKYNIKKECLLVLNQNFYESSDIDCLVSWFLSIEI